MWTRSVDRYIGIDTLQVLVTFYVLVVATVARLLTQVLTLLAKIFDKIFP